MKILWFTNIMLPQIAKKIGMQSYPLGGWMVKLADMVSETKDIDLVIAFPFEQNIEGETDEFRFCSFKIDKKVSIGDLNGQDLRIREIIEKEDPALIHIFGTEYSHSYVVTEVCKELKLQNRMVISIQGLTSVYARHFESYLPHRIVIGTTARDILRKNIIRKKREYEYRGTLEINAIKNADHVIGRTDWDRACTYFINPDIKYHFNNEMLRDSFYSGPKWTISKCAPHSIFVSQAGLPLKGLHIVLEAVAILKSEYPDIKLNIAGKSYYKRRYKLSYYEKYILSYIKKKNLEKCVRFTGFLNEQEMCDQYLNSNVFVSASSIENSPNSLCEAMILGVPVVSSMVGGVSNLLTHGEEGFYYQADAPYMLAYYIREIFESPDLAAAFSANSAKRARERHDPGRILLELLDIYQEIISQ